MGCCVSSPAGDDGNTSPQPAREQQQTATATSIASPLPPLAATTPRTPRTPAARAGQPLTSSTSAAVFGRASSSAAALVRSSTPIDERFSAPLSPPPRWRSTDRSWTPSQIARERAEFFDTRVTNRPEIWSALRNVCELVRSGDLATAQGILDASGCTLPTGNLVDGCYDEAGNLYRIPDVIISDPVNISLDVGDGQDGGRGGSRSSNNIDGDTMIGLPDSKMGGGAPMEKEWDQNLERGRSRDELCHQADGVDRHQEDKGKASERDTVKVRCRLSDRGGPDVVIWSGKGQDTASIARKVQLEVQIQFPYRIRLAYLGHMLDEKETLEAQGWKEGHVINALVVGGF